MAEYIQEELKMAGLNLEVVAGSFAPDTANAPTDVRGRGFTVAYTSTGTYTVTFVNKFAGCVAAVATLQLASADDKFAQMGTITNSKTATNTAVIRVLDASGAAVAQVAANAQNRVNFAFIFKRDSSLDGTGIT